MMISEGDRAPAITIDTSDGSSIDLGAPGQPLVLYFYPKDDTAGCTKEAQDFTALAPEFAKVGASVLGVSKDTVASHGKFAKKYDLAVTLGSDPAGEMVERYGSWVEKSLYGRKYMGIDRSTFLIKDGKVVKIWRKVRVPNHAQQVLDAARAA
jgi:thioredoxin-dependent peroxiredoxin